MCLSVQGPRIIPSSITPTGTFSPSPTTLWSVTFDQAVSMYTFTVPIIYTICPGISMRYYAIAAT